MEKKYIYIIAAIVLLGGGGVVLANVLSGPQAGGTELRTTDQVIENPRPTPQPQGNTFNIMTPEEKAAAEAEAARRAEEAALQASSTATTTATSTEENVSTSAVADVYAQQQAQQDTLEIQQGLNTTVDYGLQDPMYSFY